MLKRSHLVVVGTWYYLLCTHCNETLPLLSALQHLEYITEVSPWCKFCKNLRQPFVSCSYMSSQLVVSVQCPQPTTSIRSVSIMNVGMNAWRCVPFVRWVNNDVRARRWKWCGGGGHSHLSQPHVHKDHDSVWLLQLPLKIMIIQCTVSAEVNTAHLVYRVTDDRERRRALICTHELAREGYTTLTLHVL